VGVGEPARGELRAWAWEVRWRFTLAGQLRQSSSFAEAMAGRLPAAQDFGLRDARLRVADPRIRFPAGVEVSPVTGGGEMVPNSRVTDPQICG
jgi:hypothetical protein